MDSMLALSAHLFIPLLLLYISIHRRLLPKFNRFFSINSPLTTAWNFTFHRSQFVNRFGHDDVPVQNDKQPCIRRYVPKVGSEEGEEEAADDCAVCLCKIEEGDEIRELRCDHLFHRVCLDRWVVGYKCETCPLCRGSLAPRKWANELIGEGGVLSFNFCSFGSRRGRSTWWLI